MKELYAAHNASATVLMELIVESLLSIVVRVNEMGTTQSEMKKKKPTGEITTPLVESTPRPPLRCTVGSSLPRSLLDLFILACMQKDLVRISRIHPSDPLCPIIRNCIGEYGPRTIKGRTDDRARSCFKGLQPGFAVLVPERRRTITTRCCERPMLGMEYDGVYSKDKRCVFRRRIRILSMASKAKIKCCVFILHILYRNPSLYRTNGEPVGTWKA